MNHGMALIKQAKENKMPSPTLIRTSRLSLGLTQQQAGALIGATARAWRAWEAGTRVMPGSKWELFNLKTKELKK